MGAPVSDKRAASPQSVTRVIRIIEALCASAEPVSLADLSRRLETPKSSLAALLRGLSDEGFVIGSEGAWRLGPGAFGLGSALAEARRRLQSSDLIRESLRRLCVQSGETVLFAVGAPASGPSDDRLTYVDVVESRNVVRYAVSIGETRPFHATAGGRALLAAADPDDLGAWLKQARLAQLAPSTITDASALREIVAKARELGYAQTVDQAADGVTGTAAVVRDAAGVALGALVIAAPTGRAAGRLAELACMAVDEAALLSRSLGYRPGAQA